ncbi:hypothetical protein HC823_01090 [Candidatus Gracilibacteria bacterium]|nr:hypothetical protein [Candidatus Gracilibacteria bacterium]
MKLEDEDSHTKIEEYLIGRFGDTGKKIHTGRSRNDQVLVMMRYFLKNKISRIARKNPRRRRRLYCLCQTLRNGTDARIYPHAKSYANDRWDVGGSVCRKFARGCPIAHRDQGKIVDQNPLGSGAGYGSPFDFDRDWLSKELGFARTQNNPIYCQNSRGKIEGLVLEGCCNIMLTLNKFASDMLFFTTQEFQFLIWMIRLRRDLRSCPKRKT